MATITYFVCDWHDRDYDANSATMEDDAYEQGWARFTKHWFGPRVYPEIKGADGRVIAREFRLNPAWNHDERHICPACLRDRECRDWLERDGYKVAETTDDLRNVAAADAA